MLRERDPFGRALNALRTCLREGAYGQGQPLPIADIARDLDLSSTPVREALSRLVGEGLVEDRRGRGFFCTRLDATALAELYDLQHLQLGFATVALSAADKKFHPLRARQEEPADIAGRRDFALACEALFDRVVEAAGHHALRGWHQALADRLGPARRIEALVLRGVDDELERLVSLYSTSDWVEFRAELRRFHRRRSAAVTDLATVLRGRA